MQDIPYCSEAAVDFADKSMEMISYYAISASSALAKERGAIKPMKGLYGAKASSQKIQSRS